MKVKKTGKEYPHHYERIISKELFDKCQEVRLGWSNQPFKSTKYGTKDFIFRGLIKCAVTGVTVTSEHHKRKTPSGDVKHWTYLRAHRPDNPEKNIWVREEKVITQVENILKRLTLQPEILAKVISYIEKTNGIEREFHKQQVTALNKELLTIKNKIDKLTDLLLEDKITQDVFDTKRDQLSSRRKEIIDTLEQHVDADDNFTNTLIDLVKLSSNAYQTFKSSTNERKRRLLNLLFLNLSLEGDSLLFTVRSPFDEFLKCSEMGEWWAVRDLNS